MTDLTAALYDIVDVLEDLHIPYVVMGGIAVRVHGIPRPTHDVDFTISLPRASLPQFFANATAKGFTVPEAYETGWVDQVAGMPLVKLRIYLESHGVDVDVFLAESNFQRSLLSRRQSHDYEGRAIAFVSPEDLILLKLVANRPRDLIDVGDVLFVQGQLDETYLRSWADELGVRSQLDKVLAESQP